MADEKEVKQLSPEELESLRIDNELKALDLEEKRIAAARRRDEQQQKKLQQERNARDMAAGQAKTDALLKSCNHLKGGRDYASLQKQGTDGGNYSVIKHRHSFGNWEVICTRCTAVWKKGDTAENHPTGISFETAMKFPTDNEPSGSVMFGVAQQPIEIVAKQ